MRVIVYSTKTCPYCKMLGEYLWGKKVGFEEKFVDMDEASKEEMLKMSGGFLGVPFTVVEKDDGTKVSVIGFNKGELDRIFDFRD